ncbi:unnamed protein product [Urochloa decumbens]|uniref:Uncharacterized protein n=1 Tax=Urochloa decumbens TaxID=240449 RepID=A0ABC9DK76_9POAL
MDAAVSLSVHHRHAAVALPLRRHSFTSSAAAAAPPKPAPPLAAAAAPPKPSPPVAARPRPTPRPAPPHAAADRSYSSSSRAATGYAAALADASARAGTLHRAARHARALLFRRPQEEEEETDPRVAALVRMLVGKGKAGVVPEVLAEFAAICDRLLPLPAPARAHHAY